MNTRPNSAKLTTRVRPRTALRFVLITFAIMSLMVLSFSSSANYQPASEVKAAIGSTQAPATLATILFSRLRSALLEPMAPPPKADLDQTRNGTFDAPIDPPTWVNGNAGSSNAHYFEGQSIPYRIRMTNIALTTHVLEIEWDIKHSGVNAIDYITHYDRIAETPLPCLGVSGCNPATFNVFPIPAPSNAGSPVPGQPLTSFNALPGTEKVMTIYNGTIQSLTYVSQGDLNASSSATRLQINFTAASSTVVIAWGGHIASASDWGAGNSAGGISGSPYHTRLISFDGSGGNQDRSLSASAVQVPGVCQLSGPTVTCESDSDAHYEVTNVDAGATYSWTLVNNTSGATITNFNGIPANGAIFADVDPGGPGSYTVRATPSNTGGAGASCEVTTPVQSISATTDLTDGQSVCAGTNVNFSTTASGGDGNCSLSWTLDGNPLPDTGSSISIDTTGLSTGNHTVEVSADCNCDPPAVQSATFEVKANPIVTITLSQECATISKLTATGGFATYAWSGPTPVNDPSGICGVDKACLLVNKTGVYTVNITDPNFCPGSQTAQLCFSLTSPAPSAPARAAVTVPGSEPKVPAQKPTVRDSFLARLTRAILWPF